MAIQAMNKIILCYYYEAMHVFVDVVDRLKVEQG